MLGTCVMIWADTDMGQDDEYQLWSVAIGDDDGDPVGKIYSMPSESKARGLAQSIARDRHLPIERMD